MKKIKLVTVAIAAFIVIAALSYCAEAQTDGPYNKGVNGEHGALMLGLVAAVAAYSVESGYDVSPYVELGRTYAQSDHTVGGAGVVVGNRWDFNLGVLGEGYTKNGQQKTSYYGGISRIISPNWRLPFGCFFKTRVGAAYVPNAQLVGETNYRIGLLADCEAIDFEIGHTSSGGIYEENAGIDLFLIRMAF